VIQVDLMLLVMILSPLKHVMMIWCVYVQEVKSLMKQQINVLIYHNAVSALLAITLDYNLYDNYVCTNYVCIMYFMVLIKYPFIFVCIR